VRFGVLLIQDAPAPEVVAWARELDAAGVETVWVADHLINPFGGPGDPFPDAWTLLGTLAAVTRRARIGPLVSPMTFRTAAGLARAAQALDELSGGRAELGVGAGGAVADHERAGVEAWEPRERARRLAAWVPRIAELLDRPVPITLGGQGPTALRLAARHAARWNTYGKDPDLLDRTRERGARLDELLAAEGRGPADVTRSLLVYPAGHEEPWASTDALDDLAGRAATAGMDELVLYWPPDRWYRETAGADAVLAAIAARAPGPPSGA
jgi:alkanesulfonate monooxygenase SsuD/methylene tetrahydromethanopterin reductase-like flavin-dependent oxidoreductase (luciferase family)